MSYIARRPADCPISATAQTDAWHRNFVPLHFVWQIDEHKYIEGMLLNF